LFAESLARRPFSNALRDRLAPDVDSLCTLDVLLISSLPFVETNFNRSLTKKQPFFKIFFEKVYFTGFSTHHVGRFGSTIAINRFLLKIVPLTSNRFAFKSKKSIGILCRFGFHCKNYHELAGFCGNLLKTAENNGKMMRIHSGNSSPEIFQGDVI
jgi:hypothetical protein